MDPDELQGRGETRRLLYGHACGVNRPDERLLHLSSDDARAIAAVLDAASLAEASDPAGGQKERLELRYPDRSEKRHDRRRIARRRLILGRNPIDPFADPTRGRLDPRSRGRHDDGSDDFRRWMSPGGIGKVG